jgi:hypothetical protein
LKLYKTSCRKPHCIQLEKYKFKIKDMINNSVKLAQYKLSQHRVQGTKSKLNIFEVAQLMDALKNADQISNVVSRSIFNNINLN